MPRPLTGRNTLDELTTSVRKAAALKAALELDVFSRIAEGNRSLPAFCRATGFNERAARLLLDALANMGLMQRTDFEYTLSPTAETYLVKGKPEYYGEVLLTQWAWEARAQTARAVRNNKPLNAWLEINQSEPRAPLTWYDPETARNEFATVWDEIQMDAQSNAALNVLAFGVEAGLRALSLLQKFSRAKLLVLDHTGQFPRLRTLVESLQFNKRVEWQEGDWLAPLTADHYDLVIVDTITETRSIEENIGVLHHAHESLKLGGWIVLRAAMEEDDRRGPGLVPLWAIDLLLGSVEADVYTRTEYRGMLEAAGFFDVKPVGERLNLWTARRLPPPPPPPPVDTLAPDFIPAPEVLT
ncbi:MAG TPA: methyltransferase dimerization domain-containing protein [Anaerolineae bacterium]|nr:methyltransferase dimerization domain-containing protein [Anaerolineae bacterium]